MTELKEAIEKYAAFAAVDYAVNANGSSDPGEMRLYFDKGFTAALFLLWPCVETLISLNKYETIDAYSTDDTGYIGKFHENAEYAVSNALKELKAKVGAEWLTQTMTKR